MTICTIKPMPEYNRKLKKFRTAPPPAWADIDPGGLTAEDFELALGLFKLLDEESQEWYGGQRCIDALESGLRSKLIK